MSYEPPSFETELYSVVDNINSTLECILKLLEKMENKMPLKKSSSKKAFVSNLKAELAANKPKKQALAIAYSVQRKAKGKKK